MKNINQITGLTPQQEKAAVLLAGGKTMTETAKEIKIERSTLYQWAEKENFTAYYNSIIKEIRDNTKTSLFGLVDEAYKAIRESLKSGNQSVKLKAALAVIDRIKDVEVGETDPVKIIRQKSTHNFDFDISFGNSEFNEQEFKRLMQENNLDFE